MLNVVLLGVLANVIAGLAIIFTRPYRVGEYIELLGVRQAALGLAMDGEAAVGADGRAPARGSAAQRPQPLGSRITAEIEAAHRVFVETLGAKALWRRYLAVTATAAPDTTEL